MNFKEELDRIFQPTDINCYQQVSTGLNNNKLIPIDISIDINRYQQISSDINVKDSKAHQKYECDYLYDELIDLITPDEELRGWYIKRFYKIGKDRTLQLASIAKNDGKNPNKLFTYLLNKEYECLKDY